MSTARFSLSFGDAAVSVTVAHPQAPQLSDLGVPSLVDSWRLLLLAMVEAWANSACHVVEQQRLLVGLCANKADSRPMVECVSNVVVLRPRHARKK